MHNIVGVHGVGQQMKGEETLRSEWLPRLKDGLTRAGFGGEVALTCAFYGDLFRRRDVRAIGEPKFDANDIQDPDEEALIEVMWREASRVEGLPGPDAPTRMRAPRPVQRALNALSGSKFFTGVAERALIFDVKQTFIYLKDEAIRTAAQARVEASVTGETRVIVAHSLGSVVAYETLCKHPDWPVSTFVTLGSPLGIRNLVFERLRPSPQQVGHWPACLSRWINIADNGDIVALVKQLQPLFEGDVQDVAVHNGSHAHNATHYLTAEETGRAIAAGLVGS